VIAEASVLEQIWLARILQGSIVIAQDLGLQARHFRNWIGFQDDQ
jgi:hypothetical protein